MGNLGLAKTCTMATQPHTQQRTHNGLQLRVAQQALLNTVAQSVLEGEGGQRDGRQAGRLNQRVCARSRAWIALCTSQLFGRGGDHEAGKQVCPAHACPCPVLSRLGGCRPMPPPLTRVPHDLRLHRPDLVRHILGILQG